MRIFIGFDNSESAAFWILRSSIISKPSPSPVVVPLDLQLLTMQKLYWRIFDPFASTAFTYTRFLVPHLMGYKGWAMFMDCDMFVRSDLDELLDMRDDKYAVMCVKHDHKPPEKEKMDGAIQTQYPRKNWSSLVLWNCGHESNKRLTPEAVNSQTGTFLHQFQWLKDEEIGEIPLAWNWLDGWNTLKECPNPNIVHFTRGVPGIHEGMSDIPFAAEYLEFAQTV